MAIPMLKIRRPNGRLIFNMGIPIPGKDGLYIETGCRSLLHISYHYLQYIYIHIYMVQSFKCISRFHGQSYAGPLHTFLLLDHMQASLWPMVRVTSFERHCVSNHGTICSQLVQTNNKEAPLALYKGNPSMTGIFPSKRDSDTKVVSMSWWDHIIGICRLLAWPHQVASLPFS